MAACTQITYEFDELPLLSDGSRRGGFMSGTADIAAYSDDEWYVRAIKLDGIELEKAVYPELWALVANALEAHDADAILEQVRLEEIGTAARMRAA